MRESRCGRREGVWWDRVDESCVCCLFLLLSSFLAWALQFILQYASCDVGPVGPHRFIDRLLYPLPAPGGMGACKLALHNAFLLTLVITVMLLRIFTLPSSLFLFSGSLILVFGMSVGRSVDQRGGDWAFSFPPPPNRRMYVCILFDALHPPGEYGLRSPVFSTLSCTLFGLSSAVFILQLSIAIVFSVPNSSKGPVAQPKKDADADANADAGTDVSVNLDVGGERYSNTSFAQLKSTYSFHYPIGLAAVFFMTINIIRTPQLHGMCLEVESSDKWALWLSTTLQFLTVGGVAALVVINSNLMAYIGGRASTKRKKWMGSGRGGRTE